MKYIIVIVAFLIMLMPLGLFAQRLPSTPMYWLEDVEIDGEFGEWKGLTRATTKNSLYGDHQAKDAEAEITLATDGSTLYLYADVQDDTPTANSFHSALAWKGDSLDLYFGPSSGQRKEYNDSDAQLRLTPRSKEDIFDGSVFIGYDASGGGIPLDKIAKIATVYGRRSYTMEVAIPLSALNISGLKIGQRTRCDFQLNDADEIERDRLVKWSSDEDDYYTPAKWGYCVIEKK